MDLEYDVQILILIQTRKEKEGREGGKRETETGDRESGLQRSEDGKKT